MRKALLRIPQRCLTVTSFAAAAEIVVKMLNKGSDGGKMVFEPTLVKSNPATPSNSLPPTSDTMPQADDRLIDRPERLLDGTLREEPMAEHVEVELADRRHVAPQASCQKNRPLFLQRFLCCQNLFGLVAMKTCRRLAYPNEIQLYANPMGGGH